MKHTSAWVSFSYLSFGFAVVMLAIGLYMMPLSLWGKGYLSMGMIMLVHTTVSITKTLRDKEEADRLFNKIEDARTEELLLGIKKGETA